MRKESGKDKIFLHKKSHRTEILKVTPKKFTLDCIILSFWPYCAMSENVRERGERLRERVKEKERKKGRERD